MSQETATQQQQSGATAAKPQQQQDSLHELWKTPECLKDKGELESSVDNKPTDGPPVPLAQKMENFSRFTQALRHENNRAVARPFIIASVLMLALPLVVFNVVYRIVLPLVGLGDVPLDEAAVLGFDRVTFAGVCAVITSWIIMVSYTVYAYNDTTNMPVADGSADTTAATATQESAETKKTK